MPIYIAGREKHLSGHRAKLFKQQRYHMTLLINETNIFFFFFVELLL